MSKLANTNTKEKIKLFEDFSVRYEWDEDAEKWWLSVVDICAILTESDYQTARKYWKVIKGRIATEGSQLVTDCYQLKMKAPGAMSETGRCGHRPLQPIIV